MAVAQLIPGIRGIAATAVAVVLVAGCGDDSSPPPTDPGIVAPSTLRYDGDNLSAPTLAAGGYEAGARFTGVQIGNRVGKHLTEVSYYISTPAEVCSVMVYGAFDATKPGTRLYAADVTSQVQDHQWNTHTLSQPIALTGEDVWVCLQFSNSVSRATLGCDPGPAVTDGDWLYATSDATWAPLNQRFGISINWNIHATIGAN